MANNPLTPEQNAKVMAIFMGDLVIAKVPTLKDQCDAMRASLPGFPYMLEEFAQEAESQRLTECAEQTDSPGDLGIAAIDEGCNEFAAAWEHSGRP